MKTWIGKIRYFFLRIKRRRQCKKFASRNYPVRIELYKKSDGKECEWVLVRNLDTHQYGGWLLSVKDVERMWGKDVVDMLRGNPKPAGKFL